MPSSSQSPIGLYIHIPWCIKKCPYCDFNSHEKNETFDEASYTHALIEDLRYEHELSGERPIHSIFFGGGTPSLFSPESIQQILATIEEEMKTDDNEIEITLESNPGTFEIDKFAAFKDAGINRLSVGVQSFDDRLLRNIGRIHDSAQARVAISSAKQIGFSKINVDLMYGLPGQSLGSALDDVDIATGFDVDHISHYQLTIEPNTLFYSRPPTLPESDDMWEMQIECQSSLQASGYLQYEVSSYSKAGFECMHNLNYWQFGDYLGIGAGAHGKITNLDTGSIERRVKRRQPRDYISHAVTGNATSKQYTVEKADIVLEYLMNALRLKEGFEVESFESRTSLTREDLYGAIDRIDPSLLSSTSSVVKTSDRGYRYLNEVLESLI